MKKLTLEEVEAAAKVLNMQVMNSECGKMLCRKSNSGEWLEVEYLDVLSIEIEKPAPEITQENLEKFVQKEGRFPKCSYGDKSDSQFIGQLSGVISNSYNEHPYKILNNGRFDYCKITDERWPDLLEGE